MPEPIFQRSVQELLSLERIPLFYLSQNDFVELSLLAEAYFQTAVYLLKDAVWAWADTYKSICGR